MYYKITFLFMISHLRVYSYNCYHSKIFHYHKLFSLNRLFSTPTITQTDNLNDNIASATSDNNIRRKRLLKVRQHVNPLASSYQQPIVLPEKWISENFADPNLPFNIDVGCSKGTWALESAENFPNFNYLGLEIRRVVVEEALRRKQLKKIKNLHYMYANANVDIKLILEYMNASNYTIGMISIQFPDPHFKKRHQKRRVVNTEFVDVVANYLKPGAYIYLQSDILEVIEDMVGQFSANPAFTAANGFHNLTLTINPPLTIKTEREIATLAKGLPVYRMLFQRSLI